MADNLQLIKGIGPIIEQRLHNAGIHNFDNLVALSKEEIASILPGVSVRQITRQRWIPQARNLVKRNSKTRSKASVTSTSRQHYENFTFEFLLDDNNGIHRLRAVHVQSGAVGTWSKWDIERFIEFLSLHTGNPLAPATIVIPSTVEQKLASGQPGSSVKPSKVPALDAYQVTPENSVISTPPMIETVLEQSSSPLDRSTINRIRLNDWKILLGNTDQALNTLSAGQTFDVRLSLDLSSTSFQDNSPLIFRGILYAKEFSSGKRQYLCETREILPYSKILNLTIGNNTLASGFFRLEALVFLKPAGSEPELKAFFESHPLRVY